MEVSQSDFEFFESLWIEPVREACISVAVEFDLFERIQDENHDLRSLSLRLNVNESVLDALLLALQSMKLVVRDGSAFNLTASSRAFLTQASSLDRSESFRGDEDTYSGAHLRLRDALKNGAFTLGFDGASYTEMWKKGEISLEAAQRFTHGMQRAIQYPAQVFSHHEVFSGVQKLVDLGGGSGAWARALIAHQPKIKVQIFDLPPVLKVAREMLSVVDRIDQNRIEFFEGNFFEKKFPGADAYLFSNILHDWNPADCRQILKNLRSQIPEHTKLFIHECLLDESRIAPLFTVLFHLLMRVNHQSQQFTKNELDALLMESGFSQTKSHGKVAHYELLSAQAI